MWSTTEKVILTSDHTVYSPNLWLLFKTVVSGPSSHSVSILYVDHTNCSFRRTNNRIRVENEKSPTLDSCESCKNAREMAGTIRIWFRIRFMVNATETAVERIFK